MRPGIRLLLDNIRPCPAYVLSRYGDVLAANPESLAALSFLDRFGQRPVIGQVTVRLSAGPF